MVEAMRERLAPSSEFVKSDVQIGNSPRRAHREFAFVKAEFDMSVRVKKSHPAPKAMPRQLSFPQKIELLSRNCTRI
jgi:hypothetical protein